jgi:hypothetical protein
MNPTQFSVDPAADEGFFVIVSEDLTVYESYASAVADVQQKVSGDTESFVAEVTIDSDGGDDVAISLEQVGWQQIIQDMTESADTEGEAAGGHE